MYKRCGMIDVNDVSMKFNLGIEKNFSLKLWFIGLFKRKKQREEKKDFWALKNVSFTVNRIYWNKWRRKINFVKSRGWSYETNRGKCSSKR